MTTKKQIKELEEFLKLAFYIDGKCEYQQIDLLVSQEKGTSDKVMTFILNDSKRGRFKVALANIC